jgi:hypothetical protein
MLLEALRRKMKTTMMTRSVMVYFAASIGFAVVLLLLMVLSSSLLVLVIARAFYFVSTSHALAIRRHGTQVDFGHRGYDHLLQSDCGHIRGCRKM